MEHVSPTLKPSGSGAPPIRLLQITSGRIEYQLLICMSNCRISLLSCFIPDLSLCSVGSYSPASYAYRNFYLQLGLQRNPGREHYKIYISAYILNVQADYLICSMGIQVTGVGFERLLSSPLTAVSTQCLLTDLVGSRCRKCNYVDRIQTR